jgi:hypothetical protein
VKKGIICMFICMLMIVTVFPLSATLTPKSHVLLDRSSIGTKWNYKSMVEIPSPNGNSYRCIMFCDDHQQTLQWISLINESGFEKAWQKKFIELTIFFCIPGTILFFGLADFRNWYSELLVKTQHKDAFLDFLDTYDIENGSGMITYIWLSGISNRPVDFKAQPDNTWIENSWILDNSDEFIPNPELWIENDFLWYFDFPWI